MSTTEATVRAAVLEALGDVAPEADLGALDPSLPLQDALDIDSMDFLTFIEGIAARTGVDVPERDYASVATLDDCIAYVIRAAPA